MSDPTLPNVKSQGTTENLDFANSDFEVLPGHPLPLGPTLLPNGINFSIYSQHAKSVTLVIFLRGESEPVIEFPLDPQLNRTGYVWHIGLRNVDSSLIRYGYRMSGREQTSDPLMKFDPETILLDPYARAITGAPSWGEIYKRAGSSDDVVLENSRRCMIVKDDFDWEFDRPLNIPLSETVIYEMHVRSFTVDSSSHVDAPGTFAGLIEKIPHLKELGVTAIELLPINEFEEIEALRRNPQTGERLLNLWGYNSIAFFAPKTSYAKDTEDDGPVREFKEMVKAMHRAGIEIILDIVFNHTAEGNEHGPTYSFRGIDNPTYYIVDRNSGAYHNYSGCGNTLNCNHPVVRDFILDCLRYWVTEMHVDGFRFDLASILGRGQDGSVLANPPLLERIAADPVLANTKLIAEAWDAAGLYQVGSFPAWGRWAEWNGRYRDDIRRFVRGEPGMVKSIASRLTGSADIYQHTGRAPFHSINFITSHDGFTLQDLVSYNYKYNWQNGEENRDGSNDNSSWNCGTEGETVDPEILKLRQQQLKNFVCLLFVSHGVPMILSGDEYGRSQGGNNNAYCQDNETSWIDWNALQEKKEIRRFFRLMIAFRRDHQNLRRQNFSEFESETFPLISWHGTQLNEPDWSEHSHSLAMHLYGDPHDNDLFLIANCYWESLEFELPDAGENCRWHRVVDTSLPSPEDISKPGREHLLPHQDKFLTTARTVVLLIAKQ